MNKIDAIRACPAVLLLVLVLFSPHIAHGGTIQCKALDYIAVESANREDARHVCRAARDAASFLSAQGLTLPKGEIRIKIVSSMLEGIPESAIGAYSSAQQRIFLLTYRSFKARHPNPLGAGGNNRVIYRSIVAHEVAHAMAFDNFDVPPSMVAQEYIGFVTLFSTMPRVVRERIFQRYANYNDQWMTYPEILYLGDPVEFGVHAYRHFLLQENGRKVVGEILRGEMLGHEK